MATKERRSFVPTVSRRVARRVRRHVGRLPRRLELRERRRRPVGVARPVAPHLRAADVRLARRCRACAWRFASWLHDVEDYVNRTFARVRRILTAALRVVSASHRPADDSAPRRRFGLAFESRPASSRSLTRGPVQCRGRRLLFDPARRHDVYTSCTHLSGRRRPGGSPVASRPSRSSGLRRAPRALSGRSCSRTG